MLVDLHSHSTASDGSVPPSELPGLFFNSGVAIAGLTDHDTDGGLDDFLAACDRVGIIGVPGIEFTTRHRNREVHLLGYGLNRESTPFRTFIKRHHARLRERCSKTCARLAEYGFSVSIDHIYELSNGNPPMPPYVLKALADEGYLSTYDEAINFFREYLTYNAKAWVDYETPVEEPMKMILESGGLAIVAHPVRLAGIDQLEELLDMGAHGFELHYPDHDANLMNVLEGIALKRGCVVTGGCDYHGKYIDRRIAQVEIPLEVGMKVLEHLKIPVPDNFARWGELTI